MASMLKIWRRFLIASTWPKLALLAAGMASIGLQTARGDDITAYDLNRIARNHVGGQVFLSEYNISFAASSAHFAAKKNRLHIKMTGTYLDLREAAQLANGSSRDNDIELALRLDYSIDLKALGVNGFLSADTSEVIEVDCADDETCVSLVVMHGGKEIEVPAGMSKVTLAGFGRPNDMVLGEKQGNLISALCRFANHIRRQSGLAPVCE